MSIKRVAIGLGVWSTLFTGVIHKKGGNLFDQQIIFLSHGEAERLSKSAQGDHVWTDAL
jgi:hypothetical protein